MRNYFEDSAGSRENARTHSAVSGVGRSNGGTPPDDLFRAEIVVFHEAPNNQVIRIRIRATCHDAV